MDNAGPFILMRKIVSILLLTLSLLPVCVGVDKAKPSGVLPASFNGWQKNVGSVKSSTDPAVADQADSEVLKEYGFSSVEIAVYTREDRKMHIKAARFNDASGAYGAFSFYLLPEMQTEKIPDQGVSNNSRVLFYRGNILVDVSLDRVTAMSAADLRALSEALPHPDRSASGLPALPSNLPKQSYLPHTIRYILGPVALERLRVPVPAALVDFSKGAEVTFARYKSSEGEANLTVISYPTPQIAGERMRAMQAASLSGGPFQFKRSGPIVAIVNGSVPEREAQSLLASVNYDAEVTWNQATKPDPRNNIGNLIIGIFMLIGAILLVALIFGFAFGGIRIVAKRLFPDRVFDRPDDVGIIRLNLK